MSIPEFYAISPFTQAACIGFILATTLALIASVIGLLDRRGYRRHLARLNQKTIEWPTYDPAAGIDIPIEVVLTAPIPIVVTATPIQEVTVVRRKSAARKGLAAR